MTREFCFHCVSRPGNLEEKEYKGTSPQEPPGHKESIEKKRQEAELQETEESRRKSARGKASARIRTGNLSWKAMRAIILNLLLAGPRPLKEIVQACHPSSASSVGGLLDHSDLFEREDRGIWMLTTEGRTEAEDRKKLQQ